MPPTVTGFHSLLEAGFHNQVALWPLCWPASLPKPCHENYMIFWKESEGGTYIYRYNGDNRCRWVLKPKGGGEYWLITGSQTEEPGKLRKWGLWFRV